MIVVREVVGRHVKALGAARPAYLLASAAPLLGKFGGWDSALVADRPRGLAEPAVLVHLVQFNAELDLADLTPHLGDRDVAVLLFRNEPDTLPLGRLLATLSAGGLRVLEARGTADGQGRTIIAVTRDATLPMRSYAVGEPVPDTDAARARLANEWQVERLQLRAVAASAQARRDAEVAKLTAKLTAVEAKRDALAARVTQLEWHPARTAIVDRALPPGSTRRAQVGRLRRRALGLAKGRRS